MGFVTWCYKVMAADEKAFQALLSKFKLIHSCTCIWHQHRIQANQGQSSFYPVHRLKWVVLLHRRQFNKVSLHRTNALQ